MDEQFELVVNDLDGWASMILHTPCPRHATTDEHGKTNGGSCITVQESDDRPWPELRPVDMCPSCALYWHLCQAMHLARVLNSHALAGSPRSGE
jgi:hypothetical protein